METTRTLVPALLLATVAVLASGTATAGDSQNPAGHFLGALKAQGSGGMPDLGGAPNLTWHGGPVMHSTSVYSIYWAPAGYSYQAGYGAAIDKYFRDVASDSGKTSNVYAVNTQYTDGIGPAAYASIFTIGAVLAVRALLDEESKQLPTPIGKKTKYSSTCRWAGCWRR